jgi:hypothetical protein
MLHCLYRSQEGAPSEAICLATASLDAPDNTRHLHLGGHNGEAQCTEGRRRARVPAENAGMMRNGRGLALNLCLFCVFFVPRRKWGTAGKFLTLNGGDDGTRTRGLCRDRAAF